MTHELATRIMENEYSCVIRASNGCDRKCEKCDLLLPTDQVMDAYEYVLECLHKTSGEKYEVCN